MKTQEEINAKRLYDKERYNRKKEEIKIAKKLYYNANKEKILEEKKTYYENNGDKIKKKEKTYRDKNKDVLNTYRKILYYKNIEHERERRKTYVKNNREKVLKAYKNYNKNNKEKIANKNKKYRIKNAEELKKKKKIYNEKNKKIINVRIANKRKNDVLFGLKHKISNIIRKSFKLVNTKKTASSIEVLGCSVNTFKPHLESKFEPWMNWDNRGLYNGQPNYGWDIDHIIPLSTAKTKEDVIRLNHYTNLQPLCSHINRDIKRNNL